MEKMIWTLVLLSAVWSSVAAITVNIPQNVYEVARGDNVTLPCTFTTTVTTPKLVIVTWTALAQVEGALDDLVLTYYYPDDETDIQDDYKDRASLNVDLKTGTANLKLNSITLNDNREFECQVQIPKDPKGQTADKARLLVLVAPSPPICKTQGKAEYGQNINLTCVSEEGSPAPTYKWAGYTVANQPRVPDPKTTDQGGILSLFNITKDTSGFYICTSSNKIRSSTCNFTLSVMPPSMMSVGSTAAIIGGVAAALILLVIIIYCCCCKKKQTDEKYEMGIHEEEHYDKEPVNGEIRRVDGQETNVRPDEAKVELSYDRRKDYDDRRSDYDDRRSDYDDRRSDYTDRRKDYDDRRSDYDDRRSDYTDRRKDYDDRRSDYNDRRSDYDDRRKDYNDRRSDYDDRRSDYDDRRSDYNDRRSDYDDRRSDYNDRRSDYDDRRSDYDDRRNKYGDRRERYDDEGRYNDRRDPRSDNRP